MLKIWFQNISEAAWPLPRNVFSTRHDTRALFPSLGMLVEDGEKQKERFATSKQVTGERIFHVRCDRVEIVLAPERVGERLGRTSDGNLKCFTAFFHVACHEDSCRLGWFPSKRLKDLVPITVNLFPELARKKVNMIQEAVFNIPYLS